MLGEAQPNQPPIAKKKHKRSILYHLYSFFSFLQLPVNFYPESFTFPFDLGWIRRGLNQAANAAQTAFGAMGQQVQKAATQAATQAAVNEVQHQFSNMMKTGFKK